MLTAEASAERRVPLVSVIIPSFNSEATLAVAVNSVLAQTFGDLEVIVIDDASGRPQLEASGLGATDDRVREIRLPANGGAAAARNYGVRHARGELIAFLDADDWWKPTKLEEQTRFMMERGADISFTGIFFVQGVVSEIRVPTELDFHGLLLGCDLSPGSTMMVRREVFHRIGPIDEELRRLEDWAWLLRCAAAGYRLQILEQPLATVIGSTWPSYSAVRWAVGHLTKTSAPLIGNLPDRLRLSSTVQIELSAAAMHEGRMLLAAWHALAGLMLWYPRRSDLLRRIRRNVFRLYPAIGAPCDKAAHDSDSAYEPVPDLSPEQLERPIRVLHIISGLDVGGAETMLSRLTMQTPRTLLEQRVVSLKTSGKCAEAILRAGIPVISLGMNRNSFNLRAIFRLVQEILAFQPDAVQGWMYHGDLAALVALMLSGRRRKTRLAWGVRCSDMDTSRYPFGLRQIIRLCSMLSGFTDVVVANSIAGQVAHARLGYHPPRVMVVPNGIDTIHFRPRPECRAAVREQLGISADARVVVCVARVDPMKDYSGFLLALSKLDGIQALLIGKGTEELPAQPGVHRLGLRSDIPELLSAGDLIISPSAFGEGFSNALAEGMACGLIPVATDVGDAALIVADTGLTVPPRDPTALAAAITTLLTENAEQRAARSAAARARIVDNFGMAQVISRFANLYHTLITT